MEQVSQWLQRVALLSRMIPCMHKTRTGTDISQDIACLCDVAGTVQYYWIVSTQRFIPYWIVFTQCYMFLQPPQTTIAKERRELKEQQQRTLMDAIPKDISRPWEDPMADPSTRALSAELRGVGLAAYEAPEWCAACPLMMCLSFRYNLLAMRGLSAELRGAGVPHLALHLCLSCVSKLQASKRETCSAPCCCTSSQRLRHCRLASYCNGAQPCCELAQPGRSYSTALL